MKIELTKECRRSINFRSYAHFMPKVPRGTEKEAEKNDVAWPEDWHTWPRVHLEWQNIDAKIARQRLDDFKSGMQPVWEFIQGQTAFFRAADALSAKLKAKGDAGTERAAVVTEVDKLLKLLPNLEAQVTAFEADRPALVAFLAGQVEESCAFWVLRDVKKNPPKVAPVVAQPEPPGEWELSDDDQPDPDEES